MFSEELYILASCFLSPTSRNSVFDESRVNRFAVIQEEVSPKQRTQNTELKNATQSHRKLAARDIPSYQLTSG